MQTLLLHSRLQAVRFLPQFGLPRGRTCFALMASLLLSLLWSLIPGLAQAQAVTFSYNGTNGSDGSPQSYTVPAGIDQLNVVACGAKGGDGFSGVGRNGGCVQAILNVTPGQTFAIYVGGTPPTGLFAGYNGGGTGGLSVAGGGGGGTDLRLNGSLLTNRVLVAGGGGGGGGFSRGISRGGVGGGLTGNNGEGFIGGGINASYDPDGGGRGGTQLAGGVGQPGNLSVGQAGGLGIGGNSIIGTLGGRSGAGGGGYYGGGSGGEAGDSQNGGNLMGGGGGGSSYTHPTLVTTFVHTRGVQSGNGLVTITPCTPTVTLVFNNSATVMGTGIPTITVPNTPGQSFQVLGGNRFERVIVIDRINGYEIRQTDRNTTGVFAINRLGLFSLTVTNSNGCSRTVQGILVNP